MEQEQQFLKAHTIKEVSKKLDIPEGTLRQWEKDFDGVLHIPRNEQNYRYYTDFEIETLNQIKTLREKDLSIKTIREILSQKPKEDNTPMIQPTVPQLKQSEVIETLRGIQNTLETLPEVRELIVSQIREDIKKEIREEMERQTAAAVESTTKPLLKEIRELSIDYKNEINRRDQVLIENMNLLKELKEEKNKSIFKRIFNKS